MAVARQYIGYDRKGQKSGSLFVRNKNRYLWAEHELAELTAPVPFSLKKTSTARYASGYEKTMAAPLRLSSDRLLLPPKTRRATLRFVIRSLFIGYVCVCADLSDKCAPP